uniref:Uncharacterized protein n=1 Tax=Ditylenchus dipsaci TaxID=166011 RepID=A0A915DXG2_9BILA
MTFNSQKSARPLDTLGQQLMRIKQDFHQHINQAQPSLCSFNCNAFSIRLTSMIFLVFMAQSAEALSCYETVNGITSIKQNDTWIYCSIVPSVEHGEEKLHGIRFGVGPENDGVEAYQTGFSNNDQQYRVLTICIYERYDFSRFLGRQPGLAVEFAFRCVCNYDLCNSEATFYDYLKVLKKESFVVN